MPPLREASHTSPLDEIVFTNFGDFYFIPIGYFYLIRNICLVHIQRNICQAVRIRDRKEIMDDFKGVYSKASREECDEAFAEFASKWSKPYPKLVLSLAERQDSIFRFYEFPKAM